MVRASNPGGGKIFYTCPDLGVKQLGHGTDDPPPSNATLKKEQSYTSTPSTPHTYMVCYGVKKIDYL
jgi:hypothetical protein